MLKRAGLLIVVLMFAISSTVFALSIPKTHLVSVQWLAKNLNNPKLVIVDVRAPNAYKAGHIPHAVNIPMFFKFVSGNIGNIKFMLDTPKQVTKLFRKNGISNNSIVVFYGDNSNSGGYADAVRAFWVAWVYGMKKIAILHGGINAWKYYNEPMSKKITHKRMGHFNIVNMRLNSIATWPDIYYALATKRVQLIDGRPFVFYSGKKSGIVLNGYPLMANNKSGHIPGAVDIFAGDFSKKVHGYYVLRNSENVRRIFLKHHINLHKPIITYCFIAHWGSAPWFVGKFLAGARMIRVYDGSMVEYTRMPLPITNIGTSSSYNIKPKTSTKPKTPNAMPASGC